MIKSWTLEHFKSVYEKTTIEIAPLTIFAGANSSGKSTLIQSLLLTAQTLQSPVHGRPVILNGHIVRLGVFDDVVSNSFESDEVRIGFELIPFLGSDPTLRAFYPRTYYTVSQAHSLDSIASFECYFTFSAEGPALGKEVRQLQPILQECSVKANLEEVTRTDEGEALMRRTEEVVVRRTDGTPKERLAQFHLTDSQITKLEPFLLEYEIAKPTTFRPIGRSFYAVPKTGKPIGVTLEHFLPGRIQLLFNTVEEQAKQLGEVLTQGQTNLLADIDLRPDDENLGDFRKFVLEILEALHNELKSDAELAEKFKITKYTVGQLQSAINELRTSFSKESLRRVLGPPAIRRLVVQNFSEKTTEMQRAIKGKRPPEYTITFSPLPELPNLGIHHIQNFFGRLVKYLGPLRDEPKPVYPLAGATDPKDIGFRGENTAAVLEAHTNTRIRYIATRNVTTDERQAAIEETTLGIAVLDWLEYMGVASDVKTFDKGKLGYELKVAAYEGEALHDLTHVGVGVSQVLPILVLSLLAETGSTLIFEQPELHLHPRVQTRLADFFVSMTVLQKQCIVETHSEYLINRLRYRAAVSEGDIVSKNVIMYFVEKERGHSTYRTIRINRFGVIEDWPRGFFDENEENAAAILRAAMNKRKKEKLVKE